MFWGISWKNHGTKTQRSGKCKVAESATVLEVLAKLFKLSRDHGTKTLRRKIGVVSQRRYTQLIRLCIQFTVDYD